jgi:hypothetical protein
MKDFDDIKMHGATTKNPKQYSAERSLGNTGLDPDLNIWSCGTAVQSL